MFYRDYQDLKQPISWMRFAKEAFTQKGISKKEIDEHLEDGKRSIRRQIHQIVNKASWFESLDRHIIDHSDEYGCRYTELYKIAAPDREWMEEYIKSEIRKVDSVYDCSGQWFTTDIRFAHMRDDIYLVKHSLTQDV